MAEDIGKGHLARHDQRRGPRQQAESKQRAADQLDRAGERRSEKSSGITIGDR